MYRKNVNASAGDQVIDERMNPVHEKQWFNRIAQAIMHKASLSALLIVNADLSRHSSALNRSGISLAGVGLRNLPAGMTVLHSGYYILVISRASTGKSTDEMLVPKKNGGSEDKERRHAQNENSALRQLLRALFWARRGAAHQKGPCKLTCILKSLVSGT